MGGRTSPLRPWTSEAVPRYGGRSQEVLDGVFERHFGDWESPPQQEVPPVEPHLEDAGL